MLTNQASSPCDDDDMIELPPLPSHPPAVAEQEDVRIHIHTPPTPPPPPRNPNPPPPTPPLLPALNLNADQLLAAFNRNERIGKTVMGFTLPPVIGVFFTAFAPTSPPQRALLLCPLVLGSVSISVGLIVRNNFHRFADALDDIGCVFLFFTIFALISQLLPHQLEWIPFGCFLLLCLSIIYVRISVHAVGSSDTSP